jgi:transposase
MSTKPLPVIPLSAEVLSRTPPEARELIVRLLAQVEALLAQVDALQGLTVAAEARVKALAARVEALEAKLNKNSSNSNKPPSSDSPFAVKTKQTKSATDTKKERKRRGFRQQLLPPTETQKHLPERCSCGCTDYENLEPYYTHQIIELPEIVLSVLHVILYKGRCSGCGKTGKAHIPFSLRIGFGPRLSALIVELTGAHGDSRRAVQDFLQSVFSLRLSQGVIQKIVDRSRQALEAHYAAIREVVHSAQVNHADETTWKRKNSLEWLWLLCNTAAAFFLIHSKRSRQAFLALVGEWQGILVSDGYGVYQQWTHGRQTCLAHLIRRAAGLAERSDPALSKPGAWALSELRLLCRMAKHRPRRGEWLAFYARLMRLIGLYQDREDEVGQLVRFLRSELDHLWLFLEEQGVSPTNNHAERTLRYAVLWRKRSFGTRVEKGDRFVERILSVRQTCRLQGKRVYPVLVDAMHAFIHGTAPDLTWIHDLKPANP